MQQGQKILNVGKLNQITFLIELAPSRIPCRA